MQLLFILKGILLQVSWLNNPCMHHHIATFAKGFAGQLQDTPIVPIAHIYWEANQVDDYLATMALQGDFYCSTASDLDSHCRQLLQGDDQGVFLCVMFNFMLLMGSFYFLFSLLIMGFALLLGYCSYCIFIIIPLVFGCLSFFDK